MQPEWINNLNWKQILGDTENDFKFFSPITDQEIAEFENQLGVEIPPELLSLYKTSNGIKHQSSGEVVGELIWSSSKTIKRNLEMRNTLDFADLYMPFDCLLFFAESENGNLFGTPILNKQYPRLDVFIWNHEDDSRTWISGYLHKFIDCLTKGVITP